MNAISEKMESPPKTDQWFAFAYWNFDLNLWLWSRYLLSYHEPGKKLVAGYLVPLLAFYCRDRLYNQLKDEVKPSYKRFISFPEEKQLGDHSKLDYSLSLFQSTIVDPIPLILFEEKLDLAKVEDSPKQYARHCREMFEEWWRNLEF